MLDLPQCRFSAWVREGVFVVLAVLKLLLTKICNVKQNFLWKILVSMEHYFSS